MSVAVGTAQPASAPSARPGVERDVDQRRGRPSRRPRRRPAARPGAGRAGRPATNSRLSSSPATKKKIASSPSAAHCARVRSRCQRRRPDAQVASARCRPPLHGEFAQTSATTAAMSSSTPPTVSVRRMSAIAADLGPAAPAEQTSCGRWGRWRGHGTPCAGSTRHSPTRLPGTPATTLSGPRARTPPHRGAVCRASADRPGGRLPRGSASASGRGPADLLRDDPGGPSAPAWSTSLAPGDEQADLVLGCDGRGSSVTPGDLLRLLGRAPAVRVLAPRDAIVAANNLVPALWQR